MWTREVLKNRAKGVLKDDYWKALIVSFLIMLTGGSHNSGSWGSGSAGGRGAAGGNAVSDFFNYNYKMIMLVGATVLLIVLIRIFIGYMVEVGGRRYFIDLTFGSADIGVLGYGFGEGRYANIFKTMLLRSIYIFLWTLLLIIPGIVKAYAYRMVPYILAENPDMSSEKAIQLSNEMTMGEKLEIFVLDLSFIGWFILGALFFGIGIFFVQPYYDATNAELYMKLREKAISKGLVAKNELVPGNMKI